MLIGHSRCLEELAVGGGGKTLPEGFERGIEVKLVCPGAVRQALSSFVGRRLPTTRLSFVNLAPALAAFGEKWMFLISDLFNLILEEVLNDFVAHRQRALSLAQRKLWRVIYRSKLILGPPRRTATRGAVSQPKTELKRTRDVTSGFEDLKLF